MFIISMQKSHESRGPASGAIAREDHDHGGISRDLADDLIPAVLHGRGWSGQVPEAEGEDSRSPGGDGR